MDVRIVAVVVFGLLAASTGAFAVQPGTWSAQPVRFDETLAMGMTGVDVRAARDAGYVLPRAQVFYGQFRYVVGYYGVESVVDHVESGTARRQFGEPLAVFVSDFSGSEPFLTDGGFIDVRTGPEVGWVRAREASFVVGSRARTPAGSAIVPFSNPADARAFAREYGGAVKNWAELRATFDAGDDSAIDRFRAAVDNRSRWADRVVDRRIALRERPVSVVVGEDAPTVAAAVDAAPPNTTVLVPPGTYEVNLTVDKPITIRGRGSEIGTGTGTATGTGTGTATGTVFDGGGSGTTVTITSDRAALVGVRITNTGTVGAHSLSGANASEYADRTMLIYGRSDAGVVLDSANESLVADVTIETEASGIVLRYSDRAVVRNVTVRGTESPESGLMGIMPMYSTVVIESATITGGRDGVYTHRADGTVIRTVTARSMRYGIHEMYTSGLLVANNTVDRTDTGIMLMTRPANNFIVGNRVTGSRVGILTVGDASYVARNVLFDNELGLAVGTSRSIITENTVVSNEAGLRVGTLLPTNTVVRNDVVDNGRPVEPGSGPVHVWSTNRAGNYWGSAAGIDRDGDGTLDSPFRPTDPVDVTAGRVAGGATLVRSPALALREAAQGRLPGLRAGGVLDRRPRTSPVRPTVLAEVRNATDD